MKTQPVLFAVVGLLVGLAVGFVVASSGLMGAQSSMVTKDVAGQRVLDWLNANEVPSTVLAVNEEGSFYKVTVKSNASSIAADFYITRDGKMLVQPDVLNVTEATRALDARRAWFECLNQRGLRMFGSTETNSTLLQLQAFGGTKFVDRIYIPCEGQSAQTCVSLGVTEVPTFFYANQTYSGAKSVDWLINLTGCALTA